MKANNKTTYPNIYDGYTALLNKLTFRRSNGVREFFGGPLHLSGNTKVWITPTEIKDNYGVQQFHILYVNSHPTKDNRNTPAIILKLDEMALKLARQDSNDTKVLKKLLSDTQPKIIIRPTRVGMLYYPNVSLPHEIDPKLETTRITTILKTLGLGKVSKSVDLEIKSKRRYVKIKLSDKITFTGVQQYDASLGRVMVSNYLIERDPWKYYQIISEKPLTTLNTNTNIPIRVDSGCDIGQIYFDKGCDCREQLHVALKKTLKEGGIIIHIPTQDGRGYGMVTKMETEGLKRGIPVVTNRENPSALDTITAAETLFGEKFDIRTFDGVGQILQTLGIKDITMFTNNKRKIETISALGIKVTRKSGLTHNSNGCDFHVRAKLRHPLYINDFN